jgi:hypothetical protein
MVVLAIVAILVAFLIPANLKAEERARRIKCVSNLKNVGLSYRIFATDHGDKFPWELATNAPPLLNFDDALKHYLAVTNELSTPKIMICPADNRKEALDWKSLTRSNVSYFLSLNAAETFPQSFLAGDRNLATNDVSLGSGIFTLPASTNISWDGRIHKFQGNAVMGDGSVQQLSTARMREQVMNTGLNEMKLAIP